jgi:hypothetical protein
LYYFGEQHSYDPSDKQWIKAKNLLGEFIEKTANTKKVAIYEGGRAGKWSSETEAITNAGGTGFIVYNATKLNIEIFCPEPDRKYELVELEKNFSREEIEYYYFTRVVAQWWRKLEPQPDFEKYITHYLKRDEEESGWANFDFSLDNMKKIHKKVFSTEFDHNDKHFFREVASPVTAKTIINKVCRACGDIREESITKKIFEYWSKGYSIFIEYGSGHAVREEPLLREKLSA